MASFSFARPSQPTAAQMSFSNTSSFNATRRPNGTTSNDPLQPLRAMADRVGKEVEKFAERVDQWHTQGNESAQTKHQATAKMLGKFRDYAETQVKDLKSTTDTVPGGDLTRSTQRRLQSLKGSKDSEPLRAFAPSSQSIVQSIESDATPELDSVKELREWQAELATWELVQIMVEHYHHPPGTDAAATKAAQLKEAGGTARFCKNSEIWDRFLILDDQAKEKALVLRWLQKTAQSTQSEIEAITRELERSSGHHAQVWTNGWQHTKAKIKQTKRLEGAAQPLKASVNLQGEDRTLNLVTQLDPDVAARQNRALDPSDDFYERAVWMVCYEMLRRGLPWKHIVEYCHDRNEAWRGVSMGVADDTHVDGLPNLEGPTVGYLFRRMCFHAARGARSSYEGAVYGLLSGDLKQVQIVSKSWEDQLYAYYNALLLSRFDTYLIQQHRTRVPENLAQKFVFQDAVANLGTWKDSPQAVIALLKQQQLTKNQSIDPMKLIQCDLIGRDLENLVLKVGVALAEMLQHDERFQNLIIHPDSSTAHRTSKPEGTHRTFTVEPWYQAVVSDPHAFRILVHVFIAFQNGFKTIDSKADSKRWIAMDNVIAAYIEFLRISKRIQLIPIYGAQLLPDRAVYCLSRVLPDIKNSEEQRSWVGLLNFYGIDVITIVSQAFLFASRRSGFSTFDDDGFSTIKDPIKRFHIVEKVLSSQEQRLWPGVRIKREFGTTIIEPKEEAIIEALQWYLYVKKDYEDTFDHLSNALAVFLLHGRIEAASRVVEDLSVEALSLSRTEALCGYPFDVMIPGTEEQDERQLYDFRDEMTDTERAAAIPLNQIPDAGRHREIVEAMRKKVNRYYQLQQLVRLLVLFREWREEEVTLISIRNERAKDPNAPKVKPDTQRTKEIVDAIETIFTSLITTMTDFDRSGTKGIHLDLMVKKAYMPDIVLAYLSVLQAASFFLQRDFANKAMDIAVLVADEDQFWLQRFLIESCTMSELVDALAHVSKAMLRLTEHEPKKVDKKKRGSKGETLRIWDLGTRDR